MEDAISAAERPPQILWSHDLVELLVEAGEQAREVTEPMRGAGEHVEEHRAVDALELHLGAVDAVAG
jgi:hypothetical protein